MPRAATRRSSNAPFIPADIACHRLTMKRKENRVTNALPAPMKSISCLSRFSGFGRTRLARTRAAIPTGMLMKMMKRHPRYAAMNPPRVGPVARPTAILVALIPRALPRSDGGNAPTTIAGATAIIMPAVTPWMARAISASLSRMCSIPK